MKKEEAEAAKVKEREEDTEEHVRTEWGSRKEVGGKDNRRKEEKSEKKKEEEEGISGNEVGNLCHNVDQPALTL